MTTDAHELPIKGRTIERLSWPALYLHLSGRPSHSLWIEGAFRLTTGETTRTGDPSRPAEWWFELVGRTVREALTSEDGSSLTLSFADGSVLVIYPLGPYETWHLWVEGDEDDFG
jgi:hypothetical protein